MKNINEKKVRGDGPEKDDDEFKFKKRCAESDWFDIDRSLRTLRIFRAAPSSPWWAQAVLAAQFAVLKHAEDGGPLNLTYKQLLKANVQSVEGELFYLTFTAIDNVDGIEKVYRSRLWAPPDDLLLRSLECYDGYEKSAEELRKEITILFDDAEARGIKIKTPEYYLNRNHPIRPRVMCIPKRKVEEDTTHIPERKVEEDTTHIPERKVKKDTTPRAFLIFLNEIRSQKPNMKYAMARRFASRKWRSFGIPEKLPYMRKAEDLCKEQNLSEESSSHHA